MKVNDLLNVLKSCLPLKDAPPMEASVLWEAPSGVIYLNNQWGPAVPYPPVVHEDGTQNYGYRRLKNNPGAIESIPELMDSPELKSFILAVNASDTDLESVGCEKSAFPVEGHPAVTSQFGAYIDIIFSDYQKNADPENLLRLAAELLIAVEGCESWWGKVEIGISPLRHLDKVRTPWGVTLRVSGFGRDEAEARLTWAATLSRLTDSIKQRGKTTDV